MRTKGIVYTTYVSVAYASSVHIIPLICFTKESCYLVLKHDNKPIVLDKRSTLNLILKSYVVENIFLGNPSVNAFWVCTNLFPNPEPLGSSEF